MLVVEECGVHVGAMMVRHAANVIMVGADGSHQHYQAQGALEGGRRLEGRGRGREEGRGLAGKGSEGRSSKSVGSC